MTSGAREGDGKPAEWSEWREASDAFECMPPLSSSIMTRTPGHLGSESMVVPGRLACREGEVVVVGEEEAAEKEEEESYG